jgi:replicative DNA helicase
MVEGRRDFMLSDLRGAGTIEQDADVVIFVDRAYIRNKARFALVMTAQGNAEPCYLVIKKNRNGAIGEAPVLFLPTQAHFVDYKAMSKEPR